MQKGRLSKTLSYLGGWIDPVGYLANGLEIPTP